VILDQRVVAMVPMKAHSERVPNKNLREFAGRPLFEHILQTLESTYAVDEVLIDTDSDVIASLAAEKFSKVRIIPRPQELIGDFVSMNKIIAYDMSQAASDIYLQTHSTNPLLSEKTISRALREFTRTSEYDSLFSVNRLKTRLYWADGRPINHDPNDLVRTQDLPPVYEENSCLYVFTRTSFEQAGGRRIGQKPMMFLTEYIESIDIDDEYTFRLAELLAKYAQKGG